MRGPILLLFLLAAACGVKSWPRPPGSATPAAGPAAPQPDAGARLQ